jgi:hypothetical protein
MKRHVLADLLYGTAKKKKNSSHRATKFLNQGFLNLQTYIVSGCGTRIEYFRSQALLAGLEN